MKYDDEQVKEALRFDALSTAEQITGRSYKEHEDVAMLGVSLNANSAAAREHMLQSNGDTTFSMATDDYIAVVERLGFEPVYIENFEGKARKGEHSQETLFVYFQHPGQLLCFDTYYGNRNGSTLYYNWCPNSPNYPRDVVESMSIWISKAGRERLEPLQKAMWQHEHGTPEYVAARDVEKQAYREIVAAGESVIVGNSRINKLPQAVRIAIGL